MNWLFFSTILYKIDDILKRKAEGKLENLIEKVITYFL